MENRLTLEWKGLELARFVILHSRFPVFHFGLAERKAHEPPVFPSCDRIEKGNGNPGMRMENRLTLEWKGLELARFVILRSRFPVLHFILGPGAARHASTQRSCLFARQNFRFGASIALGDTWTAEQVVTQRQVGRLADADARGLNDPFPAALRRCFDP